MQTVIDTAIGIAFALAALAAVATLPSLRLAPAAEAGVVRIEDLPRPVVVPAADLEAGELKLRAAAEQWM